MTTFSPSSSPWAATPPLCSSGCAGSSGTDAAGSADIADDDEDLGDDEQRGLTGMARPKNPRSAVDAPQSVPDRSLAADDPLPTMAIRAAGTHQFVYRKMLDGPVGAATPNHGDIVRVVDRHGVQLGLRSLERPFADQSAVPVATEPRRPARNSGAAASTTRSRCERRSSTSSCRRMPIASSMPRAIGLSGLIVDRFDDVLSVEVFSLGMYQRIGPILALCAEATGDEALPGRRRRAGRAARGLFGPAAGQPAAASARDRAGAWNSLSHPF